MAGDGTAGHPALDWASAHAARFVGSGGDAGPKVYVAGELDRGRRSCRNRFWKKCHENGSLY